MNLGKTANVASANKQHGAALLIITIVLVLFVSSIFLAGLDKVSNSLAKQSRTDNALAAAKESLINYALLSDKLPSSPGVGYLPCPDQTGDGIANTPCGAAGESVEGWLPWQTLGEKPLKDGNSVCLRYVVSGNYKINPATALTKTPATEGHFVIHDQNNNIKVGSAPADYALAVIFAPATTVADQSRALGGGTATTCGSSNTGATINRASNYLDQLANVDNATGLYNGVGVPGSFPIPTDIPSVFIQADPADSYNDQLIWVSPRDFADVYARMP